MRGDEPHYPDALECVSDGELHDAAMIAGAARALVELEFARLGSGPGAVTHWLAAGLVELIARVEARDSGAAATIAGYVAAALEAGRPAWAAAGHALAACEALNRGASQQARECLVAGERALEAGRLDGDAGDPMPGPSGTGAASNNLGAAYLRLRMFECAEPHLAEAARLSGDRYGPEYAIQACIDRLNLAEMYLTWALELDAANDRDVAFVHAERGWAHAQAAINMAVEGPWPSLLSYGRVLAAGCQALMHPKSPDAGAFTDVGPEIDAAPRGSLVRRALPWLVRARISRLTGDAEGARDAALTAVAGAAGSDPFMGLLAAREGLLIDGQLQADGTSYSMLMWQQFQTQRKEFVAAHRASIELARLERQHTEIAQARAALESALVSALAEEEVLRRAANNDPLTGLLNRRAFTRSLANSLSWRDSVSPMAVAFIDLDDFKGINDLHGHSVGDDVLRFVADRLTSCIREGDLLARFGGDEFVALVQVPQDGRSLDEWGLRVLATLAVPSTIGGVQRRVSASVGMCIVDPRRLPDVEEIIRQADAAMYAAKGRGAGSVEVRRMG